MFRKVRFRHHIGRLYMKPIPSALINESFTQIDAGSGSKLSPETLAITAVQSMHELNLLDERYITTKGRAVLAISDN